jgi:hypothetical protein
MPTHPSIATGLRGGIAAPVGDKAKYVVARNRAEARH